MFAIRMETLVLIIGAKASRAALAPGGSGTALTIELARRQKKPYLVVNLNDPADLRAARTWVQANHIRVLNVAGPRESENAGIYSKALKFLRQLLDQQSRERERPGNQSRKREQPEKLS